MVISVYADPRSIQGFGDRCQRRLPLVVPTLLGPPSSLSAGEPLRRMGYDQNREAEYWSPKISESIQLKRSAMSDAARVARPGTSWDAYSVRRRDFAQ